MSARRRGSDGFASRAVRGSLAGLLATAPMSVVLAAAQRVGALGELPPHRIARRLAPDAGDRRHGVAATALHLLVGAGSGAVYGLFGGTARRSAGNAVAHGVAHAAAVWAIGYEVVAPLLGAMPPAHRDDRRRVASMVVAHTVFGAALGLLTRSRR